MAEVSQGSLQHYQSHLPLSNHSDSLQSLICPSEFSELSWLCFIKFISITVINYLSPDGDRSGDSNNNINISGTLFGVSPFLFSEGSLLYDLYFKLLLTFPL